MILPRLVHPEESHSEEDVLEALLMAEAEVEEQRKQGSATYSIAKHIELLIALMGEARHLSQIRKTA